MILQSKQPIYILAATVQVKPGQPVPSAFLVPFVQEKTPSMLWRCWLGGRKGIRPVKTEWWGAGVVICQQYGANDFYIVQMMPLPAHHLLLQ